MKKRIARMLQECAVLLGLLVCAETLEAQTVQQSGSVTPNHAACWTTTGVIKDCGSATTGVLSSLGVTASGPAICQRSAASGAYNLLCLQVSSTAGGIAMTNVGGATGGFTFTLNGVTQGIGTVTLPVSVNNFACFADTAGTLKDCGGSLIGPAGSNTQVQFNSSGVFGASANLTWISPALTIGATASATGQVKLAGITSGTATITAQAVAGTPTITAPTASGTIAVSATSPVTLNATTGDITCPTCLTSSGGFLTTADAPSNPVRHPSTAATAACSIGHFLPWVDQNFCLSGDFLSLNSTSPDGLAILTLGGADPTTGSGTVRLTFTFGAGACVAGCNADFAQTAGMTLQTVANGLVAAVQANANLYNDVAGAQGEILQLNSLGGSVNINFDMRVNLQITRTVGGTSSVTVTIPATCATVCDKAFDVNPIIQIGRLVSGTAPAAGSQIGAIFWQSNSSVSLTAFDTNYAVISVDVLSSTSGMTAARINFLTAGLTGALNQGMQLGAGLHGTSRTDKGAETINFSGSWTDDVNSITRSGSTWVFNATTNDKIQFISSTYNFSVNNGGVFDFVNTAGVTLARFGSAGVSRGQWTTCGETNGCITWNPQAAAGTYNFNPPIDAGAFGTIMRSGGGGGTAMAWTTATYPATTTVNRILYSSATNVISEIGTSSYAVMWGGTAGVPVMSANPIIGVPTSSTGSLGLQGITSGAVTIQPQAVAGTYNFNLPTSAGTSGQPMLSAGGVGAPMTFDTLGVAAGGTGLTSGTSGGIPYYSGTTTIASSAVLGALGIVVGGGAGGAPVTSSPCTLDTNGNLNCASATASSPTTTMANSTNDATGHFYIFRKNRAGGDVVNGDIGFNFLGQYLFNTANRNAAQLLSQVDGVPTSTFVPTKWQFLTSSTAALLVNIMTFNSTGQLIVPSGVASTSTVTGTVVVTGGVGVSGAIFAGGGITSTANATAVTPPADTLIHTIAANSTVGQVSQDTFAQFGSFTFRRANTSAASPSGLVSGNLIGGMNARGYTSAGAYTTVNSAAFFFAATETWSSTAQGSEIQFYATPNTTATTVKAMTVQNSGGVSIGSATDPGLGGLYVNGATVTLNGITTDAAHTDRSICQDTTSKSLFFGSGALGVCLGTSSARFKRDIEPYHGGLALVSKLEPKQFYYREGYGDGGVRQQIGLIAEDVLKIEPRFVDLDSENRANGLDWPNFIWMLVNAAKELKAANDNLKQRVYALERRIAGGKR